MINPWCTLGVHRQSTDKETHAAYIEWAVRSHPDRGGNTAFFQQVVEAWTILKDKKRTSIFIREMIIRNKECSTCKGVGATFKSLGLTSRNFKACTTCGGAGVMISEKENSNVTIELQSSGAAGGKRDYNQRKAGANKRRVN